MAGGINMAVAAKQLFAVRVDWVDVPEDRLRALKTEQARAIGEAIKADRQYDAIAVTQLPGKDRFLLVDGLHRLEGCRMAGIEMIEARLVSANRESRRRQEVLSAWARADHDVFDKAAQVAAMAEMAKADPADEDEACNTMLQATRWDIATAEALLISRMQVFRLLKAHRFYSASQKRLLRDKNLAGELTPLIRLAALPPEEFAVAWAYLEGAEEPSISEALTRAAPVLQLEPAWDRQKAKVLTAAATWQPHQISELIADLRALHSQITGKGAA